jgi:arabinofuranan 3-O-arabinosyltransferase
VVSPRAIAVAVWPIGTLMLVYRILQATEKPQGYDTVPLWNAVRALIHGRDIYTSKGAFDFLYPPSALAMSLPLGLVSVEAAKMVVFASNLVGILVGSAILIRVFNQPLTGLAGALTVLGLSLAAPVFDTLKAGNVNGVVLLAEAVFVSAAARGSWNVAGLGLGLSLALKPVLAPLIVVPILYRKGGTILIALGIPVAMSGLVLVSAPRSRDFFSDTVPQFLRGQSAELQDLSASLPSVLERLSLPEILILTLRVAAVVAVLVVLWERFKDRTGEPARMIELGSVALIGAFLTATFTWTYYGLFLLPLAISVLMPRSSMRWWVSWVGVYCVFTSDVWKTERLPNLANDLLSGMFAFGLAILLCSIWVHSYRTRHSVSTRGGCEPG